MTIMPNDQLSQIAKSPQGQILHAVFAFTVLLGYGITFSSIDIQLSSPVGMALIGICVVYILLGTFWFEWLTQQGDSRKLLLYFGVQVALIVAAILISPYFAQLWLMVLPLVSHAVMVVPSRWVPAVILITIGSLAFPSKMFTSPQENMNNFLGITSGVIFVGFFTSVMAQADRAREQMQQMAERLEEMNQQLREYAMQAEELATSKERNRLAREIHDSLGHYLTVINVQLEAARAVLDTNRDTAYQALEKAQSLAKDGLSEVRRSVAALRASPMEGRPLTTVIESLLEECRTAGIQSELDVSGEPRELPAQIAHALYRATQEGLTNVRRHARASSVHVALDFDADGGISLCISDNGVGVDLENLEEGFGLFGLRERVHMLDGRVSIQSVEPKGSSLEVFIPV
jgi:signal transduction histidine kinase